METKRIIIDEIKETDKLDFFLNIAHDKKVLETFMCNYEESIDDFDFSRYLTNKNIYAIRLKDTLNLIGIILYFNESENCAEVGYALGSNYFNNGYMTEALTRFIDYCFNELGFNKLYASFFKGNDASKRVMEKSNMVYDHIVYKELMYQGIERDLIYYSINK